MWKLKGMVEHLFQLCRFFIRLPRINTITVINIIIIIIIITIIIIMHLYIFLLRNIKIPIASPDLYTFIFAVRI